MSKVKKIPVHRMEDWFSGVYIKPMTMEKTAPLSYERALPHRHDFYYCVLLNKGKIESEVDFQSLQLTDHSLFISYPGQVHRIISTQTKQGWFLAFDPAMLDQKITDVLDQCLSEVILINLPPEQSTDLSSFVDHLYRIYNDQNQLFQKDIVQSIVQAFVYQAASAYLSIERSKLGKHPARSIQITKIFKQMLRRNFKSLKKPSDFAKKMNMTTSHLNDTIRSVTGFPVTYHIQQELFREAQRLLYYSGLTIKEIADDLGFEDEKYFSRLFRKIIGVSPGSFRKRNGHAVLI